MLVLCLVFQVPEELVESEVTSPAALSDGRGYQTRVLGLTCVRWSGGEVVFIPGRGV